MAGGNNIYIKTQALATVIEKFSCLAGIEQTQLITILRITTQGVYQEK